jgi:hypothetical protein
MSKHNKTEYSAHTQKLIAIDESGFRFHSLPETEEQFWHGKNETLRPVQAAKDLGGLAIKAAGIGIDTLSIAGIRTLEAASKGREKLWQGISSKAARISDEGLEELFWNKAADSGEKIQESSDRLASYLGAAAIGAAIRRDTAEANSSRFSPTPAYWGVLSRSAELLSRGTSGAATQLEKLSINEDSKGTIFRSAQEASAKKAGLLNEKANRYSQSANAKVDNLMTKFEELETRERPMTKDEKKRARELSEEHRKKAAVAHSYGNYTDASKHMKHARLQQELLLKGRVESNTSSVKTSRGSRTHQSSPFPRLSDSI